MSVSAFVSLLDFLSPSCVCGGALINLYAYAWDSEQATSLKTTSCEKFSPSSLRSFKTGCVETRCYVYKVIFTFLGECVDVAFSLCVCFLFFVFVLQSVVVNIINIIFSVISLDMFMLHKVVLKMLNLLICLYGRLHPLCQASQLLFKLFHPLFRLTFAVLIILIICIIILIFIVINVVAIAVNTTNIIITFNIFIIDTNIIIAYIIVSIDKIKRKGFA